ncbi:NUDIX domain-containing protein [Micromonospora aurantiaca]|uniref:NUDIX domain-containing protein n=1 Tax=Micromonospora aurantiaca (nom. illeg.) TaxID=47850 RepID=UPI003453B51E
MDNREGSSTGAKTVYVVKAAVVWDGKVLVLHPCTRSHHEEHDRIDLPGGKIRYGEGPMEALTREVREETGLLVEPVAPVRLWSFVRSDGLHFIGATVVCTTQSGAVRLSDEHEGYAWVPSTGIAAAWPVHDELHAALEVLARSNGMPTAARSSQARSTR